MRKREVSHSSKLRVYKAVSESLLCYGAQVWGFKEYGTVEILQRFFLKKLFQLPDKTPDYVLALETGLPGIYITTLKFHFDYLLRVLFSYRENRLPHVLALKIIEKKIYWFGEWLELAEKHDVQLGMNWQGRENLYPVLYSIIEKESLWQAAKMEERTRQTVRHGLYNKLNYRLGEISYIRDSYTVQKIRLILIYRSGMLTLNASPWRAGGVPTCSLCNLEEDEDFMHYFAICPILKELRLLAFHRAYLTEAEAVSILNGENFDALFQFAKKAWKYRSFLVEEYNN